MTPLVTEAEAAELLKMNPRTVRKARNDGRLPFVQIGRLIRYRIDDIQGFIDSSVVVNENTATNRTSTRASRSGGTIKTFTARQKGC